MTHCLVCGNKVNTSDSRSIACDFCKRRAHFNCVGCHSGELGWTCNDENCETFTGVHEMIDAFGKDLEDGIMKEVEDKLGELKEDAAASRRAAYEKNTSLSTKLAALSDSNDHLAQKVNKISALTQDQVNLNKDIICKMLADKKSLEEKIDLEIKAVKSCLMKSNSKETNPKGLLAFDEEKVKNDILAKVMAHVTLRNVQLNMELEAIKDSFNSKIDVLREMITSMSGGKVACPDPVKDSAQDSMKVSSQDSLNASGQDSVKDSNLPTLYM